MVTRNSVNTYIVPTTANEVTAPAQPAFLAYLASDDNNVTGNAANYEVGYNVIFTEVFDQNADFSPGVAATSAATFTAPVTGRYLISASVLMGGITAAMTYYVFYLVTSNRYYILTINGANLRTVATAADLCSQTHSTIADMDAADIFKVGIRMDGGAGDTADLLSSDASTSICGELLC